jgi:DNA polymerase III delta prime subunit
MHAIYEQGYSVYDIVGTMHKVLLMMEDEVHKDKLFEMLRCMAELKKRVIEGLTTEIQLGEFIAKISMLV